MGNLPFIINQYKLIMQTILVISPHPDDESIGCGGTICKHIMEGDRVEVIFLTSGEKGGHGRSEEETIRLREEEAISAGKILNVADVEFWREPDGAFYPNENCVNRLIQKIQTIQPTNIYVPHELEQHPDHKAAAVLVGNVIKKLPADVQLPIVWMYEVWTPIQQIDHIVDITGYITIKQKAIQAHNSQCSVLKFDEAIIGLNRYRGEMHSWPGGDYAEIFSEMKLQFKL